MEPAGSVPRSQPCPPLDLSFPISTRDRGQDSVLDKGSSSRTGWGVGSPRWTDLSSQIHSQGLLPAPRLTAPPYLGQSGPRSQLPEVNTCWSGTRSCGFWSLTDSTSVLATGCLDLGPVTPVSLTASDGITALVRLPPAWASPVDSRRLSSPTTCRHVRLGVPWASPSEHGRN